MTKFVLVRRHSATCHAQQKLNLFFVRGGVAIDGQDPRMGQLFFGKLQEAVVF
jgi:hypothetical protein